MPHTFLTLPSIAQTAGKKQSVPFTLPGLYLIHCRIRNIFPLLRKKTPKDTVIFNTFFSHFHIEFSMCSAKISTLRQF